MRQVWVTDAAAVTALGDSCEKTWQGLMAGRTAIQAVSRFPTFNYNSSMAACIDNLTPGDNQSLIQQLTERILCQLHNVPETSLLITATTKAGIDSLEKIRRHQPIGLSDILLSSLPASISRKLQLADKGINISAACASSTIAVAHGASLIASGNAESVLVCCMDTVTEFVFSGFSSLNAMSDTGARPFDKDRNGLTLGEGAAAILLMSSKAAGKHGKPHLGTIAGWGAANDAAHITAPARDGCGLIQAAQKALKMAAVGKEAIAAVNAHGTGTIYNDMMEITAFRSIFHNCRIPVNSVKGAIGHTLGAAGGIEVVLGLKALSGQILPPTVGLNIPEETAMDLVSSQPVNISGDYLLTTNSGFGGVNAAIVLKRGKTP